jgi:hypothetical protein
MARTSRGRFVLALVEDLMSPSHLIRNPFLCSRLNSCNRISILSLSESANLQKVNVTDSELIESCGRCQFLDVVGNDEVALRYDVRPQILIIRQVGAIASAFEFRDFVHQIKGDFDFTAFPIADGGDVAIHFGSLEQCIAVWRALRLVPFRGQVLDIQVYWPGGVDFAILPEVPTVPPPRMAVKVSLPVIEPKSKTGGPYLSLAIVRNGHATANVT